MDARLDQIAAIPEAKPLGEVLEKGEIAGLGRNIHDRVISAHSLLGARIPEPPFSVLSYATGKPQIHDINSPNDVNSLPAFLGSHDGDYQLAINNGVLTYTQV